MPAQSIHIQAPAKINLYLRVLGRRPDGYHLLATLMQKLSLCDQLTLTRVSGANRLECPDSDLPVNDDNIVLRAADLFCSSLRKRLPDNCGVHIVLRKSIPVAAGLGGGSSDAAAVLVGLDRLFKAGCSTRELAEMGVRLGADVPFFIHEWPTALATGIGERLTEADGLENVLVLLVNPGFPVSTRWVYENLPLTSEEKKINLSDSHSEHEGFTVEYPYRQAVFTADEVHNDLESVTEASFKEIALIKSRIRAGGAESALMSGSGPTVFGIFTEKMQEQARACYREMRQRYAQSFLVTPLSGDWNRFRQ